MIKLGKSKDPKQNVQLPQTINLKIKNKYNEKKPYSETNGKAAVKNPEIKSANIITNRGPNRRSNAEAGKWPNKIPKPGAAKTKLCPNKLRYPCFCFEISWFDTSKFLSLKIFKLII